MKITKYIELIYFSPYLVNGKLCKYGQEILKCKTCTGSFDIYKRYRYKFVTKLLKRKNKISSNGHERIVNYYFICG